MVREFQDWFSTAVVLKIQLNDNERFPSEVLSSFKFVQELHLNNLSDSAADWSCVWDSMKALRSLTAYMCWNFSDAALECFIASVCKKCKLLKGFTIFATDCINVSPIAKSLINLEKLALVGMMVALEPSTLVFPALRELHLDLEIFQSDEIYLSLDAPKLDYLRIPKKNIPHIHFSNSTKFTRLTTYGDCMETPYPWFLETEELKTTIHEPSNQEAILTEMNLFPKMARLAVKIMSKECTTHVPSACTFQNIRSLYINNFILSMNFFVQIAEMKLLERFIIEECNFLLDVHNTGLLDLSQLHHYRVKRVSMPRTVTVFPVIASGQPPIVLVDRLRTHLWRDDFYNVFSSQWD
ncbi:uncharacterized protein LOC129749792 isoform X2 [Uranotaenia lowii]|nr:uncharacterized protein LOC129749792 isoform X2 [Uranotaenia lowii]